MAGGIVGRLAAALLVVTALGPQPREGLFEARVFRAADGGTLPYRLFVPEDHASQERYPLVLYLHGGGGRGNDNRKQLGGGNGHLVDPLVSPMAQAKHPCIVVVPQSSPLGWVGYDSVTPTGELERVLELLAELERTYPIDEDRRYVLGQSMGGFGTFAILGLEPGRFAAAISICGGGAESRAASIAHVPVWLFHGGADDVVPAARSRSMAAALAGAGGKPRYTEYSGEGHLIWSRVVREPGWLDWMFAQVRGKP